MSKVLLTKKNIEEYICRETGSLYVEREMILSPGVKDYLQNIGIALQYGPKPAPQAAPEQVAPPDQTTAAQHVTEGETAALARRITTILRNDYQVEDEDRLRELCLRIMTDSLKGPEPEGRTR